MVLSIYSVTYASYGSIDGDLYTETKTFVDGDKARRYQQDNIKSILEDNDLLDDEHYDQHKDDDEFNFVTDEWAYTTKLEVQDYEFYFNERK